MTKLNQILAVEKGVRTRTEKTKTELYHTVQKPVLFEGRTETYRPLEETEEGLTAVKQPDREQLIQHTSEGVLKEFGEVLVRMYDVVAAKDKTNTITSASVVVDGKTLMSDVPVSFLIYMEKQLNDIETFVRAVPILPPDQKWSWDSNNNCWTTEPFKTYTTKKVPRRLVKYEATKDHPAQVDVYMEDVTVGEWIKILRHGGIPAQRQAEVLSRVVKLRDAIKFAREQANMVDVVDAKVGQPVFDYLFGTK